jgi:hypothetical protein
MIEIGSHHGNRVDRFVEYDTQHPEPSLRHRPEGVSQRGIVRVVLNPWRVFDCISDYLGSMPRLAQR